MLTMTKTSDRREALLSALRGKPGQWLTRTQLADLTGKNVLSPNDRNWLERLERDGLIEVDIRPARGPARREYLYRAVERGE